VRHGPITSTQQQALARVANQTALAMHNAQLFEQLRIERERLRALARRLVDAQETERRLVARELHDEIGQVLTGLKLLLDTSSNLSPDVTAVRLVKAQELVARLVDQVHDLSLDLRPTMLDDLGLLPALLALFKRYTAQTRVRVTFYHDGLDRRFELELETSVYRIVQEALTNVARHSKVSEAAVRLWADEKAVHLQIEDRGKGFEVESAFTERASTGLPGMRERAIALGGEFTVESTPETGTLIMAEIPLVQTSKVIDPTR
jgi:signal transduction histidine kinase